MGAALISLIPCDVSLLAELVELGDEASVCLEGMRQRLDNPVMVRAAGRPVARRRKSGRRQLEGGVVGDVQSPGGAQPLRAAVCHVALGHGQEVGDFLPAGLVVDEPAFFQPVL
jgi:hypothetical protein